MTSIRIEKPCHENFNGMPRCGNMLFCAMCEKQVADLRKATLQETSDFVKQNPGHCIVVHPRHATSSSHRFGFVNRAEGMVQRFLPRKATLCMITVLLFLTGCFSRRKKGHHGGAPVFLKKSELNESLPKPHE